MSDDNADVSADLLPPDGRSEELSGRNEPSYDVPRGLCPFCGSPEVVHLVIGMPAGPDACGSGPDWVQWVGCVHPGYTRRCAACEGSWSEVEQLGPAYLDLGSLLRHAGVHAVEGLAGWISEDYEYDAWVHMEGETVEVGFQNRGVTVEFPIGIEDFRETLDELHEEVSVELEREDDDE